MEMLHVNLEEVFAPLSIALQLFPIDKDIVDLGLPDEVHKLVLLLRQTLLVLVPQIVLGVYQILIGEVYLISVECHLIFLKIYYCGGRNLINHINILR
jgi:hypothetical protein